MKRDISLEAAFAENYAAIASALNERAFRVWVMSVSRAISLGGGPLASAATGLARETSGDDSLDRRPHRTRPNGRGALCQGQAEEVEIPHRKFGYKAQMSGHALTTDAFHGEWN